MMVERSSFFNFNLNLRSKVAIEEPLVSLQSAAMIASPNQALSRARIRKVSSDLFDEQFQYPASL